MTIQACLTTNSMDLVLTMVCLEIIIQFRLATHYVTEVLPTFDLSI